MADPLLKPDQIPIIEQLAEKADSDALQRRAKVLLFYNAGKDTRQISATLGLSLRSVQHWRREFQKHGMDIFSRANRSKSPSNPTLQEIQEAHPAAPPQKRKSTPKPAPSKPHFPRVRKNPGVKADDLMAEAGRKILRFNFAHMLSHEKGTRLGEDIEELHDMRVATRRMRAAFDIFRPYFKPKAGKNLLKRLRATGRALGRVRDLDVFLEKAGHYLATLPENERSGLEPLMNAWRGEWLAERDKLLTYLDSEKYQQFKENFNDFVSKPSAGAQSGSGVNLEPNLIRHVAPILIYQNLAAVRAYEKVISNAVIEQLHALRIKFKKLRYTLEFFREVLGAQSKEVIEDLKILQDHLGDLNDANVACRVLQEFIDTWEERQIDLPLQERQNPEPVVAYLATKHAERHNLMVSFPQAWAHFNRSEFLENVALAISVL